jgi:hypothetical protein
MIHTRIGVRTLVAIALSSLVLPSCSGGASGTAIPPAAGSAASQSARSPLPSIKSDGSAATALYVSDFYGKSVFRFARNSDGTLVTPAGSSLVLPYNPGPIAIGRTGSLFVTDEENE